MIATLLLRCPNGHETRTELINYEVHADGTVDGYAGSDADFCAVCGERPEVLGADVTVGECEWHLACHNPATTTRAHPILGDVPICARCDDLVTALSLAP